ncbi:uncharacterized protein MONBRDRAFT_36279 [Monosiga brevicollis MX1]|uniref:Glycoside hydrolase family 38 N-terminal domain-containing protein n=1 Tax=Monosiga brevicollis TaxID=81824 RepID=A9UU87_MONBE|nr:uncharacterized protein MONBRDRAFT_36279 [Monosiga brevicollis MX1]EDQ91378.1 predicted protein [Monosiga brevicollis MX1]|eukprot:XP_001743800.1 hypothetical protein [Monosiga brevicollis MX1]
MSTMSLSRPLFGLVLVLAFDAPIRLVCGEPIKVIIAPHTHLGWLLVPRWVENKLLVSRQCTLTNLAVATSPDVGWLETMDSYYDLNVSHIIPGVLDELDKDPTKRFSWAEVVYLKLWIEQDATSAQLATLKRLIAKGQWSFIDGGMVQHDQACPTTEQILRQMSDGHRYLQDHFSTRPRVGWSIDPFGSSNINALLYATMGFDALVINRIPDDEMNLGKANRQLEFVWQPSPILNDSTARLFTHIFDSYYCMPGGFRWGMEGDTSPDITPANAADRAQAFVQAVLPRADWYRTPYVLVPWGCDFMYQNATLVFSNTDRLMAEINSKPQVYNMTIQYATVDEYFALLQRQNYTKWPTRGPRDFFPLAYNMQSSKQSEALVAASTLQDIILHHDAITGTMCVAEEGCTGGGQTGGDHNVLDDYYRLLDESEATIWKLLRQGLANGTCSSSDLFLSEDRTILRALQRRQTVQYHVFNPTPHNQTFVVVLPSVVTAVTTHDGAPVPAQAVPSGLYGTIIPRGLARRMNDPTRVVLDLAPFELHTISAASTVPYAGAHAGQTHNTSRTVVVPHSTVLPREDQTFSTTNGVFTLEGTLTQGVTRITNLRTNVSTPIAFGFALYESSKDGAYLFNVTGPSVPIGPGPSDVQVTQVYHGHVVQLRLYHHQGASGALELDVGVDVLDVASELVLEIVADGADAGWLLTDTNGLGALPRLVNGTSDLPTQTYPATSWTSMHSANGANTVSVAFRQSHTVIHPAPGRLQLMLQKRIRTRGLSSTVVHDDVSPLHQRMLLTVGEAPNQRLVLRTVLLECGHVRPHSWPAWVEMIQPKLGHRHGGCVTKAIDLLVISYWPVVCTCQRCGGWTRPRTLITFYVVYSLPRAVAPAIAAIPRQLQLVRLFAVSATEYLLQLKNMDLAQLRPTMFPDLYGSLRTGSRPRCAL